MYDVCMDHVCLISDALYRYLIPGTDHAWMTCSIVIRTVLAVCSATFLRRERAVVRALNAPLPVIKPEVSS